MLRKTGLVGIFTALAMTFAVGADTPAAAKLSAVEIVNRNVAAPWRSTSLACSPNYVVDR